MASGEDYRKYFCALGSRSVRRVAAKVYAAAELDAEMRIAMMKELTQMVTWQQMAAIAGWPFDDHITDGTDGEEGRSRSTGRCTPMAGRCSPWSTGWTATPQSCITPTCCSPRLKTPGSWRRRCAPVVAGCPVPNREPTTRTSTL